MAKIPESCYIAVDSPFPALLFAFNHPLRVDRKPDLERLFRLQRTVTANPHIIIKYQKSNEGESK